MYDIVYTYVNGDDPTHIQSKQQAMHISAPEPESSHNCRFQSSCEIVFSLFSIFRFTSSQELHRIYIVISDNEFQEIYLDEPSWIRQDSGFQEFIQTKVQYIRHSQIIPMEFLPTFNSHVIELYLSEIPELLETFVYFNDDCFLGSDMGERFFFASEEEKNVKANIFPSSSPMKQAVAKMQKTSMFQTIMNRTFDLLQSRFSNLRNSQSQWNKCHHQAKALLKSSCQSTLHDPVFSKVIHQLSSHRFRSRQDFAPIELMLGYMYFTNKAITLDAKPYTFYIEWTQDNDSMQTKFETLLARKLKPILICINDVPGTTTTAPPSKQATKKLVKVENSASSWKVQALSQFAYRYFQKRLTLE